MEFGASKPPLEIELVESKTNVFSSHAGLKACRDCCKPSRCSNLVGHGAKPEVQLLRVRQIVRNVLDIDICPPVCSV